MTIGVNQVLLIGTVSSESTIRRTGEFVFNGFSIKVTEEITSKTKGTFETTEYININLFGKEDKFMVGELVIVEGKLSSDSWVDKITGEKKYKTAIKARSVKRLGKSNSTPAAETVPDF